MQITLDTHNLSDLDLQVLRLLLGVDVTEYPTAPASVPGTYSTDAGGVVEPDPEPEPEPEADPEPEPEPEPEPMAEEPVEDEPPADDDLIGDDPEEMSDEDLLALAVKKATEMVSSGDAAKVREALDAAGASRVRELNADNVREFFKALG